MISFFFLSPLFCNLVGSGSSDLPPLGVGVLDGEVAEEAGQQGEHHDQQDPVQVGQLAALYTQGQGGQRMRS